MKKFGTKIDDWIFRTYEKPSAGLPIFRIFYACFLLLFTFPKNTNIWALPPSFFQPPLSVAVFFSGFPPHWFFQLVDYLEVLGGFCLLFGCYTRFFSFFLAFLMVFINSFQYSVGKIGHEILIPALLFCMAFSNWGSRYSADERRVSREARARPMAWPMALLMLMIGLSMLTASYSKAKSGWLSPSMECCRGQLVVNYAGLGREKWLADVMLGIHSHLFWKFLDISTVILEGAFIVAIFWLPAVRFVAASACIFHGFIYFSMNILFLANPAAYASLIDLRCLLRFRLGRKLLRIFARFARRVQLLPLTVVVTLFYAGYVALSLNNDIGGFFPLPAALVATVLVIFGVWGAIFVTLQAMDYGFWRIEFPVPRGKFIVLYDGECGLCDRWVQFVLMCDRRGTILFAPLQSKVGRELSGNNAEEMASLTSLVVWVEGRTYRRSAAVAMILRQMSFPWSILGGFALIPAWIRDHAYDSIAARRHKWFPPPQSCRIPTKKQSERFIA